ncbi:MAG TPA: hypothetical protein VFH78_13110, partial [Candidatus Thermoplasmatota archaeon]|nr:hypothetical protein [Candidatus Thermoplasmatota archaeon]
MRAALLLAAALLAAPLLALTPASAAQTLVVGPGGYTSIKSAIAAASPGDTILVMPGVYQEEITIITPRITLAGYSRDSVILEGGGLLDNAVTVLADNVTVRSMTAQNYLGNAFVFSHVNGFTMTDLVAANNGEYGLYAIHSTNGDISHSIAFGHSDSGFYIGETPNCNCRVHHNIGFNNMLGYSGTANSYVDIFQNEFFHNRAGILPNVLPQEMGVDTETIEIYGTQVHTRIYDNHVHSNNNMDAPESGTWETVHVPAGMGIGIAGGWFNEVYGNRIENNHLMGIAVFWLFVPPRGNEIHGNEISGGRYGIWWDEWGENNCFHGNDIHTVQAAAAIGPRVEKVQV